VKNKNCLRDVSLWVLFSRKWNLKYFKSVLKKRGKYEK